MSAVTGTPPVPMTKCGYSLAKRTNIHVIVERMRICLSACGKTYMISMHFLFLATRHNPCEAESRPHFHMLGIPQRMRGVPDIILCAFLKKYLAFILVVYFGICFGAALRSARPYQHLNNISIGTRGGRGTRIDTSFIVADFTHFIRRRLGTRSNVPSRRSYWIGTVCSTRSVDRHEVQRANRRRPKTD